ncbi:MAG: hypothetical protein KTR15_04400 [Phycisphaeraceae bacterium]|nr:hypothetical protein [Phycisphaeraceae bacterium]
MDYRFREIRKSECAELLTFAMAHGLQVDATRLRHNLSLVVWDHENEIIAAAMCMLDDKERLTIDIVSKGNNSDSQLLNELADRCLRKVQSEAIGSARLRSTTQADAESIVSCANWLDRIEETRPPGTTDAPVPTEQETQAA